MDNSDLIFLNNEKVSKDNEKFFSRNYNFKILPEGLNKYFKVKYIVRKSNVNENHKLELKDVHIASNIFQYIKLLNFLPYPKNLFQVLNTFFFLSVFLELFQVLCSLALN